MSVFVQIISIIGEMRSSSEQLLSLKFLEGCRLILPVIGAYICN